MPSLRGRAQGAPPFPRPVISRPVTGPGRAGGWEVSAAVPAPGFPGSGRWELGPEEGNGNGEGAVDSGGECRGLSRISLRGPVSTCPVLYPALCPPLPRRFSSGGAVDSLEVTCAEAWSPGVTLGKCHRVLLPFLQSVVPGLSPVSPGPSDCGWQKPRVGLASCRSRRKVGHPASWPLAS